MWAVVFGAQGDHYTMYNVAIAHGKGEGLCAACHSPSRGLDAYIFPGYLSRVTECLLDDGRKHGGASPAAELESHWPSNGYVSFMKRGDRALKCKIAVGSVCNSPWPLRLSGSPQVSKVRIGSSLADSTGIRLTKRSSLCVAYRRWLSDYRTFMGSTPFAEVKKLDKDRNSAATAKKHTNIEIRQRHVDVWVKTVEDTLGILPGGHRTEE